MHDLTTLPEKYLHSYPVAVDARTNQKPHVIAAFTSFGYASWHDGSPLPTDRDPEDVLKEHDVAMTMIWHGGEFSSAHFDFYRAYLYPYHDKAKNKRSVNQLLNNQYGWKLDCEYIGQQHDQRYAGQIIIEQRDQDQNGYFGNILTSQGLNAFPYLDKAYKIINVVAMFSEEPVDKYPISITLYGKNKGLPNDDEVTVQYDNKWYAFNFDKEKDTHPSYDIQKDKFWNVWLTLAYYDEPQPRVYMLTRSGLDVHRWQPVPMAIYDLDAEVKTVKFPVTQATAFVLVQ